MAGDYNVMPTDLDVYAPERWVDDALFRPEVRKAYADFVKLGWSDALRDLYPGKRIYTFWKYFVMPSPAMRAYDVGHGCPGVISLPIERSKHYADSRGH